MPQRAWSTKDERQYQHIKSGERRRGRSLEKAKEIAARTVNKQRRSEGRVDSPVSRATGNPETRLEERTLVELRNRSRELHIRGRSSMTKAELIRAIRQRS
jgi:hypothetical protein